MRSPEPQPTLDWGALIARHDRRVLVALLGQGIPLDRAKELAQETWSRLMHKHARGELTEITLPGLAIKQALFLARDDQRRAKRRPQEPVTDELPFDGITAERELASREEAEIALAILARFPANVKSIFELHYDDPNLTHREIAARVQLSEQRVRQILCEVRKALRAALAGGM